MSKRPKLLPVGTQAPDFNLQDAPGRYISLSDFEGVSVVLLFYAADFHPVCLRQLTVFNEVLPEFHRLNTQVLGIARDSVWSHIAFSKNYNFHFPLLADVTPKGKVCEDYGVRILDDDELERTAYIVDPEGLVIWREAAPAGVGLDVGGPLETLEKLMNRRLT